MEDMVNTCDSPVHAVSYIRNHKVRLKNQRMQIANPRLGLNVWNVAVIDNIDFKDLIFRYGNIYNATRYSSHATLRMVFQFQLPTSLESIIQNAQSQNPDTK